MIEIYLILGIAGILIGLIVAIYFFKKYEDTKDKVEKPQVDIIHLQRERLARGIARSIAVRLGRVYEAIFPHSPFSKYNPADIFFFGGKPIDYIVFDGLSERKITQIVFLDIKSGTGSLGDVERQVKRIIKKEKDKIDFQTVHTTKKKPLISEKDIEKILPVMKEEIKKLFSSKEN